MSDKKKTEDNELEENAGCEGGDVPLKENADQAYNDETEKNEKEKQKENRKSSDELARKAEEYDNLYDKYLRINAEYDNFRKRTAKEKEGIYSDAVTDVLNNVLPVMDNMERALQFSESDKVLDGLKMIYSQFTASLERLGVEEIKSEGEQFNPEVHSAVFHEEDESKPDNTVTEVLQKGYIRGDKIIRTAMVKVVN